MNNETEQHCDTASNKDAADRYRLTNGLLLETLKRVREDYKGLITVCRHYSLHATYKDAMETVEYLDDVIKKGEDL